MEPISKATMPTPHSMNSIATNTSPVALGVMSPATGQFIRSQMSVRVAQLLFSYNRLQAMSLPSLLLPAALLHDELHNKHPRKMLQTQLCNQGHKVQQLPLALLTISSARSCCDDPVYGSQVLLCH